MWKHLGPDQVIETTAMFSRFTIISPFFADDAKR